jgi:hypothetical protein
MAKMAKSFSRRDREEMLAGVLTGVKLSGRALTDSRVGPAVEREQVRQALFLGVDDS